MNKTTLIQIAKHGQYYCPAHKHYNKIVTVECDRCGLKPLKACIGYGDKDLCLTCTNKLIEGSEQTTFNPEDYEIRKPIYGYDRGFDFFNFNSTDTNTVNRMDMLQTRMNNLQNRMNDERGIKRIDNLQNKMNNLQNNMNNIAGREIYYSKKDN